MVHQNPQFKARSTNGSVAGNTYSAGSILMLGTLRTQSALTAVKYWRFSRCVGSFLKSLILVPAGVTETQHLMQSVREPQYKHLPLHEITVNKQK